MNIKITKNINEANLITHTGTFHPDDVFSTAFLSKIVENPTVIRVGDVTAIPEDAIVYDIGFGKFDHHGTDARYRNEPYPKIKYCSFGLLWEEYGLNYLRQQFPDINNHEKLYNKIIEKLVLQIDAIDNGYFPEIKSEYHLTDLDKVIDLFNKSWIEDIDNDENFITVVEIASKIFDRVLKKEYGLIIAAEKIEEKINTVENSILFLEDYIPYQEAIFDSENPTAKDIKIVIFPSNRGGYNVKPLTVSKTSKELVVNFPKEYWGLHNEELANISQIPGARFVHLSGFLASTDTKEAAFALANKALENKE